MDQGLMSKMNGSDEQEPYLEEIARIAWQAVEEMNETEQAKNPLPQQATTSTTTTARTTPALERNTTDSSLSDADSSFKQHQQQQEQKQPQFESSHIDIDYIDADRDVLLDNMESGTPQRRIFRQVLEEYAPKYRYVKRGRKKDIVELAVQEMTTKGVRFLETDHSADHFGRRLARANSKKKIFVKVQRCFRDLIRQKDKEWCTATSLALSSAASTAGSSIRTTPTTFGGSVASARSSPPIVQVNVPIAMPPPSITTTTTSTSTKAKGRTSMTSLDDLSVSHQVSLTSFACNSTAANFAPLTPPVPTGQVSDKGEATALSTMTTRHCASSSSEQEGIPRPPSLERGLESWSSLISHGGLQRLLQEDETTENGHNHHHHHNTTSIINAEDDEKPPPAAAKRALDYLDCAPQRAAQRRRVSESSTEQQQQQQQQEERVPTWVLHLTQHMAALQHRLEMVERDNMELRSLVVTQQRLSPLPSLPPGSFDDQIWNLVTPALSDNSINDDELTLGLTF